jgi:acetylserotonin N-methyltransferase
VNEKILKAVTDNENKSELEWGIISAWENGTVDVKEAAKFSDLMHSISLDAAIYLAKHVKLKEEFNVTSILDVGGGSGCYSFSFSENQPGIKSIVLDLPEVCEVAKNYIAKSQAPPSSVLTYSSDMFRQAFPSYNDPIYGYQAIFFSNILHDWIESDKCEYLVRKSFEALPPGGFILIHEALLNDDGSGPLLVALYSFDMAILSKGRQFRFKQLKGILEHCGFVDVNLRKVYGINSLIFGRKN